MDIHTETKTSSRTSSTSEPVESSEVVNIDTVSLMPHARRMASIISLVAGCLALLFAISPFAIGWFAAIFWILYPCAALSLVTAIPAFFSKGKWRPVVGLCLSVSAIVIAIMSGREYALALAGSVNGLTDIAKTFIDALYWPF